MQNDSPLWHQLRQFRLTASKLRDVYIRRADHRKLVQRLMSTRRVQTAVMLAGLANEPKAAEAHNNCRAVLVVGSW